MIIREYVVMAFSRVRRFLENVQQFIPRLRLCVCVCVCRLAREHLLQSLGQDQSTVAQRAETTMTECPQHICI